MAHRDSIVLPVVHQAAAPSNPQSSKALRWLLYGSAAVVMLLCFFAVMVLIGLETGPVVLVLGLLMAVAPVPLYAGLMLWLDRFEPEPVRLLLIVFGWGATIAAFTAFLLNSIGTAIVDDAFGTDAAAIYGGSISAPIVEEAAKGAVLFILFFWKRSEINGVLDGVVYSVMVGLGFAMTENVLYYGRGAYTEGVVGAVGTFILRGVMSPFAHPVFTAATGIGIALAVMSRHGAVRFLAPIGGLLTAMFLHSLWNTAAGTGAGFFGVYLLIMVPIFGAVVAVVLVSRHRERQLVQRHLADGLGGFLTPAEVQMLGSAKGRREARKYLKGKAGPEAAKTLALFQEVITEYAYFRERAARGLLVNDPKAPRIDAELSNQIRSLHARLLTYGGSHRHEAGPGHQQGYQSPPQIGGVAEWGPGKGYSQVGWAVPREVAQARAAELRASQYGLQAVPAGQNQGGWGQGHGHQQHGHGQHGQHGHGQYGQHEHGQQHGDGQQHGYEHGQPPQHPYQSREHR